MRALLKLFGGSLGAIALSAVVVAQAPAKPAPQAASPAPAGAPAQPAAQPTPQPAPAPALERASSAPKPVPPPPENYTYQQDGRRDPFLSLLRVGANQNATAAKADGAPGLLTNEISVRGIMQSRGALVAAVQAPDKKTYLLRRGDKLLDGTVKAVTPEGLTIVQDVNDPLSIVKQREVQKLLRSLEDAK
jgi:Tfp pilus assembly protein PilP